MYFLESVIAVGVWLELCVGLFVAWLTWKMLQAKEKAKIQRRFNNLMKRIGISIAALILCSTLSHARIFAQWGVASAHPGTKQYSDVKFVEFGRAGEEGKVAYTVGAGGWVDHTGYKSKAFTINGNDFYAEACSSLFFEGLIGVEPKNDHFYMSYKLGPAIITNTDALLGSNLQLSHELAFGMRDIREVRVGFVLKHYSNAGIVKPNKGRDFIGMRIEW